MSEQFDARSAPLGFASEHINSDDRHCTSELQGGLEDGVRQPPIGREAVSVPNRVSKRPAHPSYRLVAQLNERWRVVDDPLQWILQRKKGNPRKKNSGWRDRSFCRTQGALLRCVAGYCGEIDANSLAKLKSLPDWHPDWDSRDQHKNLDVPETDQVQAEVDADRLVSRESEAREPDSERAHFSQSALY
jgi:hypothetical protein